VVVLLLPEQRRLRARAAAHALHSKYDSKTLTQPARDAFMARFEREVDPDRVLPEAERLRRADHARKAYFARLAFLSAKARARKGKGDAA
jgi:hypothetical protein